MKSENRENSVYSLAKKACRIPAKMKKFSQKKKTEHEKNIIAEKINEQLKVSAEISAGDAETTLRAFYDVKEMSFSQKTTYDIQYDLMIVVPVYNVEQYLEDCICSILEQKTTYSYVAVFVDDGSTDGSREILRRYEKYPCIQVIHQENRGISGARNRALEHILGTYIMFVDSDDVLENTAVEDLMHVAVGYGADIVEGGHRYFNGADLIPEQSSAKKNGMVDEQLLTGYPWGKVIKSSLFRDLCFPQGIWFEDTIMHALLYPACTRLFKIPRFVYRYRINPDGISATHNKSIHCLDTYWITRFYLEEKVKRGQVLGNYEYKQFLEQIKTNHRRIQKMPENIQESVFVLSCDLRQKYFEKAEPPASLSLRSMHQSLCGRSYPAFQTITRNWDLLA